MTVDPMPPGWTSLDGTMQPAESIAAYAARVQTVKGACRDAICNRRVTLDPKVLCGHGLGRLRIAQVKRLFSCGRIDGCRLDWHNEPAENPLRLDQFIGRANVRIRVSCRGKGCTFFRVWKVEQMIAGLQRRKVGDGRTEVDKLPALMSAPCAVCKRTSWDVAVLWVSEQTMGWRQLGERTFDRVGHGGGV